MCFRHRIFVLVVAICAATAIAAAAPVLVKPRSYTARASDALSESGKQLYVKMQCSECHSVNNSGGNIGPVLDGVGARRSSDFLYTHLADEMTAKRKFLEMTTKDITMLPEHTRVVPNEAKALVAYLLTLPEPKAGFRVTGHKPPSVPRSTTTRNNAKPPAPELASVAEGRKLFVKLGCAQCHSIDHVGGDLGPALDGIATVQSRDYIVGHISNAQVAALQNSGINQFVPTPMPQFKATEKEIQEIADYLMTLREIR